jgi:hypothetical protein
MLREHLARVELLRIATAVGPAFVAAVVGLAVLFLVLRTRAAAQVRVAIVAVPWTFIAASLARGEGRVFTKESTPALVDEIKQRLRRRIAAERSDTSR